MMLSDIIYKLPILDIERLTCVIGQKLDNFAGHIGSLFLVIVIQLVDFQNRVRKIK